MPISETVWRQGNRGCRKLCAYAQCKHVKAQTVRHDTMYTMMYVYYDTITPCSPPLQLSSVT